MIEETKKEDEINKDDKQVDMVHWEPVAKTHGDETMEKIQKYHEEYIKFWNITEHR